MWSYYITIKHDLTHLVSYLITYDTIRGARHLRGFADGIPHTALRTVFRDACGHGS